MGCARLHHASSAARTNTTVDCRRLCMATCTGCTWQTEPIYKLGVTVHRCLHITKHCTCCIVVSDIAIRHQSSSTIDCSQLSTPVGRNTLQTHHILPRRTYTIWKSLSNELRDPGCTDETFRQSLQTFLSSDIISMPAPQLYTIMRYRNLHNYIITIWELSS